MDLHRSWPGRRRAVAALAAFAVGLGGLAVAVAGPAGADGSAPTYEPDPNAVGTVALYDANGVQITSGSTTAHPFATYLAASGGYTPNSAPPNTAQAYAATPVDGVNSLNWSSDTLSGGTAFGTSVSANYPGALKNSPNAIAKATSGDFSLDDYIGEFPAGSTQNPNVFQIRVYTGYPSKFYAMDVKVDPTTNTWTQVFPTVATATATAVGGITANPSSPAPHGSTVTLTATVTAADGSHPAGTVRLLDGGTDKGAATFNASTGAVSATVTPTDGSHSYTFAFTPSASTYAASTSPALSYTVTAATASTTTLAVSPSGGAISGQAVTLTATVVPSTAAGTVTFKDGATTIGQAVAVSGGKASLSTSSLAVATHGLSAVFTPSSSTVTGSTSSTVTYTVAPKPATTTTTTLTAPAGPVAFGSTVALSATVSPAAAAGTVQFLDGSTVIGTGTAAGNGTYTFSTSSLTAGSHSLTAQFLPTDARSFGGSTSAARTLVVSAQPTSTTLKVSPNPVDQNTTATLTATLTPSSATGTVTFKDGSTTLGSAAVSSGVATLSSKFGTLGSHSVTAAFAPADNSRFAASSAAAVTVTVNKPAPSATTTTVAADNTTVVSGATVTLTATVSPVNTAGTVQFFDGSAAIGAPVTVSGGSAKTSWTPAVGTHAVKATFTPASDANALASTSGELTVTVKAPPQKTTTTLTVSPSGTVAYGAPVTFTATVTSAAQAAAGPSGTVAVKDGSSTLGTATVTNGSATFTSAKLTSGSHSLTAVFTPADAGAYAASTSAAVTVVVGAQPTTTSLGASPSGTVARGRAVKLTATLSPTTAAGTVTFKDGSTTLGTGTVSSGKAALTVSNLTVGSHQLTAEFAPASAASFGASTSAAVSLKVVTAPTISSVQDGGRTLASGDPVAVGDQVTVKGANFVAGEKVSLLIGSSVVTTATALANGTVTASAVIPAGTSGTTTLSLRGSLATVSFTVTVRAAAVAPGGTSSSAGLTPAGGTTGRGLATTGADLIRPLSLGALLVLLGTGVVFGARRTHRARHAV